MTKRILSSLLTIFFLFSFTPLAQAVDIPLLTWERGKEQNVVVGGVSAEDAFQVKLLRPGSPQIMMKPSSINKRGFLVYSANLPPDLPLGQYTVYVFGDGSISGSQVAQVEVIALTRYSITEIPKDLVYLFLTLIFIITALTVTRSGNHAHLSFLRQRTLIENETLLFSKSVPRIVYPAYLLRAGAHVRLRNSIFKFQLLKDETFIHKASPLLWALLPALGLCLGLQGGLVTHGNLANIPLYSLIALSIVGLFDAYSGVFALLGFAMGQIVVGQALNFRSVVVLLSLGLSFVLVGFISDLLYSGVSKDVLRNKSQLQIRAYKYLAIVAISLITGVFYFSTLLLTQSLSIEVSDHSDKFLIPAAVVGISAGLKIILHQLLDLKLATGDESDVFVMHEFHAQRFLSPMAALFLSLSSVFIAFIWTTNWTFSLLFGLLSLAIAATFTFNLPFAKLQILRKWRRNVFLESAVVSYLGYLLFIFIRNLPYQASLKSQIFIISTIALPLLHALVSSLHPERDTEEERST